MKRGNIIVALCLVAFILFVLSIGIGDLSIHPIDVIKTLFGSGSEVHQLVIYSFRLPRILMAFLAGVALAVSGAILQAVIRNPLASPDLLGITGGAAVAAVSIITFFSDSTTSLQISIYWIPLFAFCGATLVGGLIYFLAWKDGVTPKRLVLMGIGFYTITSALTSFIILIGPIFHAVQAKTWLTGTIYGTTWQHVLTLLPWMAILIPVSFFLGKKMTVHQFSEEVAIGVGSRLQRERMTFLLLSTALAGCAVSFVGGISFVGLVAPHISRRWVGNEYTILLPTSALVGGSLVVAADLLGRTVLAPLEIPAGVFTAMLGAPYFIYLLWKTR